MRATSQNVSSSIWSKGSSNAPSHFTSWYRNHTPFKSTKNSRCFTQGPGHVDMDQLNLLSHSSDEEWCANCTKKQLERSFTSQGQWEVQQDCLIRKMIKQRNLSIYFTWTRQSVQCRKNLRSVHLILKPRVVILLHTVATRSMRNDRIAECKSAFRLRS